MESKSTGESPGKIQQSSPQSGRKSRRRIVQSTLFRCDSPEELEDGDYVEGQDEDDDDGDEYLGSGGKNKRKRKAQSRVSKKASLMSKKSPGKGSKSKHCVIPARVDFFLKASEKRQQQKQLREQQEALDLTPESNKNSKQLVSVASKENDWSSNEKGDMSVTPCNGIKLSATKGQQWRAKSDLGTEHEHLSQPLFDLRLEEKIAAEESSRLSAGKRTHPFFSSCKATKRCREIIEIIDVETRCPVLQEGLIDSCPPVHVFEKLQDDPISLDWKEWMLYDRPIFSSGGSCDRAYLSSSILEGSVEPLNVDSFVTISNSGATLSPEREAHLDQLQDQVDSKFGAHEQLMAFLKSVNEAKDTGLFSTPTGSLVVKEDEHLTGLILERMACYHARCGKWPPCSLWTNKYQPEKALEVCGNTESVRRLSEWLRCWQERVPQSSKSSIQDSEHSWYQNESDMEDMDQESSLKNVFLVTGPVGSGKSAAIYACAKEQGFQVIEVSASDCRNGTIVKQKFGEAMESHRFNKWSQGNLRIENSDFSSSLDDVVEVIEVASTTCRQEQKNAIGRFRNSQEKKMENKSLILFEDVDTIFDDDRGFICTIMQLAETAKRPMILTSNSKDPFLPQLLDRLMVDFTLPSVAELLCEAFMVCTAEKANVSPQIIERFVRCCRGDVRKTIMLLQFWCQGKEGRKLKCTYSPIQFDIDAVHMVLPKLIPYGFPCELSNLVEKEISKALSQVKSEQPYFDGLSGGFLRNNHTNEDTRARKEAMLRRNFGDENFTELPSQFFSVGELYDNDSGSPVSFARRAGRKKLNMVLFSDSEDDHLPDTSEFLSRKPDNEQSCNTTVDRSQHGEFNISETRDFHTSDTQNSLDISCVPESSYVPETEISNREEYFSRIVSCSHCTTVLDDASSVQCPPVIEFLVQDKTLLELKEKVENVMGNTGEIGAESLHRDEEQGDSLVKDSVALTRVYPVMDECSRVDFNSGFTLAEMPMAPPEPDLVQEAWRTLCSRQDIRSYVTSEQKVASNIVNLASGLTSLISETDMMLRRCQLLVQDYIEPPMVPCEEPEFISSYDGQLEMASTFAQHGFCLYAKRFDELGSDLGSHRKVDLAREMLGCSTNSVALGKLITNEMKTSLSSSESEIETPRVDISLGREAERTMYHTILPVIPAKLQLAVRGPALHEYLSYLSQMSQSEALRLLESVGRARQPRRARTARHYLCTGSLTLSPEDTEFLAKRFCFGHHLSDSNS